MTEFFLRTCDQTGQILNSRRIEARDIYGALARANQHFGTIVDAPDQLPPESLSRIDVADSRGHIVARLLCADAIAAHTRRPH
jgi:hypothetical protein